jgi:hypothetical protein
MLSSVHPKLSVIPRLLPNLPPSSVRKGLTQLYEFKTVMNYRYRSLGAHTNRTYILPVVSLPISAMGRGAFNTDKAKQVRRKQSKSMYTNATEYKKEPLAWRRCGATPPFASFLSTALPPLCSAVHIQSAW